eukprot:scaffold255032_cov22-Prasinocladus_malaysianus.AAC.1
MDGDHVLDGHPPPGLICKGQPAGTDKKSNVEEAGCIAPRQKMNSGSQSMQNASDLPHREYRDGNKAYAAVISDMIQTRSIVSNKSMLACRMWSVDA